MPLFIVYLYSLLIGFCKSNMNKSRKKTLDHMTVLFQKLFISAFRIYLLLIFMSLKQD